MKTILVTGGAGYIGSAAVNELILKNFEVIVVDNLAKGNKSKIHPKAKLFKGDLCNKKFLETIFSKNKIDAIMHFAAYKSVAESTKNPIKYSDNIKGTINLLNCVVKNKIKKIIYSSSAAVYGNSKKQIIDERTKINPMNYYGFTKLIGEELIEEYSKIYNLDYCIFRYFNVGGDGGLNYAECEPENVLPILIENILKKENKFIIFGKDYFTKDGTCVRDYIHVSDIVDAHIKALNIKGKEIINLGSSKGFSVKELIDETQKVTNQKIDFEYGKKREGDPAKVIASNKKAKKILDWFPKRNLGDIIESTYRAYLKNFKEK